MKFVTRAEVSGVIVAPPSKSVMQRAAAAALLSEGRTILTNPSFADDGLAALRVIETLGAKISIEPGKVVIDGAVRLEGGSLDCGESGLTIRMFAPVAALSSVECVLSGHGTLLRRPIHVEDLRLLGARVESSGLPPVLIRGPLRAGEITIDGEATSQFLSGLLVALPRCEGRSRIRAFNLRSHPYVRMTLDLLRRFGVSIEAAENLSEFEILGAQPYSCPTLEIEGDWSGASCFLAAAALTGELELRGLSSESHQADRALLEVLKEAGAEVSEDSGAITVRRKDLTGFEFDATDCPDLFPALAALASGCRGVSRIRGVGRLKNKESDRAAAIVEEFSGVGINVHIEGDELVVEESKVSGGRISSRGDHRIAMAGAVLGLVSEKGVRIENPECVSKSYPAFFEDLEAIS